MPFPQPAPTLQARFNQSSRPVRGRGRRTTRTNRPVVYNQYFNAKGRRGRQKRSRRRTYAGKNTKKMKGPTLARDRKVILDKTMQKIQVQLSNVRDTVVTATAKTSVSLDYTSLLNFIESVMADTVMISDIAGQVDMYLWYYYFYNLLLLHVKRFGGLTGDLAGSVQANAEDSTLAVPYAFAKYLEYLSPYSKTVALSTAYNFSTDITCSANNGMGAGNNMSLNSSRVGLPNWVIWNQVVRPNANSQFLSASFQQSAAAGMNFSAFLDQPILMASMSSVLNGIVRCIQLKDVPTVAPDASAYGQPDLKINTLAVGLFPNQVSNFCGDFDPEVTTIFALSRTGTESIQSDLHSSPFPRPFATPNGVPFFSQAAMTWVYLARCYGKKYPVGRVRDAFLFDCKHKVKSLYRKRQYLSGMAIGNMLIEYYKETNATKNLPDEPSTVAGVSTPFDSGYQGLTYLLGVCFSVFQYYMNVHSIDGCFNPWTTFSETGGVFSPQMSWLEGFWITHEIPPFAAAFADGIAPIICNGYLRSPASEFQGVQLNAATEPNSVPGPMAWSSLGFSGYNDVLYNISNLMSLSTGLQNQNTLAQPLPPNVILGYEFDALSSTSLPVLLDSTYTATNLAPRTSTIYEFTAWTLNSKLAYAFVQGFDQWFTYGINVSLPPLAKANNTGVGTNEVMAVQSITSLQAVTTPLLAMPSFLEIGDRFSTINNNGPGSATVAPENLTFVNEATAQDATLAHLFDASPMTLGEINTLAVRRTHMQLKQYFYSDSGSFAASAPTNYSYNSSVDPPVGDSTNVMLRNFIRKFTNPSSQFNKEYHDVILKSPNLESLPANVKLPSARDMVRKYAAELGADLFRNVAGNHPTSYQFQGMELQGKLASQIKALVNKQGTITKDQKGSTDKKGFIKKVAGIAQKAVNIGNDAAKVVGGVKKGFETISALFD